MGVSVEWSGVGWGGGYRKRNMLGVDHCQEEKRTVLRRILSEGVRHYDIGVSEVSRGLHGI